MRRYVNVDPEIVPNGVDVEFYEKAEADAGPTLGPREGHPVLWPQRTAQGHGNRAAGRSRTSRARDQMCISSVSRPTPMCRRSCPRAIASIASGGSRGAEGRRAPRGRHRLFRLDAGESFGITVLEGMSGGSAVIASDIPGYRYAGGDAPVYAPPGDVGAWSAAIGRLLDDDVERASGGRAGAGSRADLRLVDDRGATLERLRARDRNVDRNDLHWSWRSRCARPCSRTSGDPAARNARRRGRRRSDLRDRRDRRGATAQRILERR